MAGFSGQGQTSSEDGLREKMVTVNRVTKVVKGGRILAFAALVVVGDGKGRIGMGKGKAKEAPAAVKKAMDEARRHLFSVPLREGSLYHAINGKHAATRVFLLPAPKGTGVIAGGAMRAVFEVMGIADIVAKVHGSTNPYNMVRATLRALDRATTPASVAAKRGKLVEQIFS
jgi:small subunit ribosomal protein S5